MAIDITTTRNEQWKTHIHNPNSGLTIDIRVGDTRITKQSDQHAIRVQTQPGGKCLAARRVVITLDYERIPEIDISYLEIQDEILESSFTRIGDVNPNVAVEPTRPHPDQ